MGAGDLDLSVRFLFTFVFGDFLAVRIPEPDKIWKFDVRRDLGIIRHPRILFPLP